jgi:predicted DNA-binding transcriptional regulator AlpA
MTNAFFGRADILARYDICELTLRRWIARGKFPAPMRLGGREIRWKISDVEAFEETRKGVARGE